MGTCSELERAHWEYWLANLSDLLEIFGQKWEGVRLQEEILYVLLTNGDGYIDCSYHSDCKELSNRIMTSELETTGSLSTALLA